MCAINLLEWKDKFIERWLDVALTRLLLVFKAWCLQSKLHCLLKLLFPFFILTYCSFQPVNTKILYFHIYMGVL